MIIHGCSQIILATELSLFLFHSQKVIEFPYSCEEKKKNQLKCRRFYHPKLDLKTEYCCWRAWEHAQSQENRAFLLWKCVTLLISFFTLFPTSSLNSVWWYIWLVVISLFMMMFWGLNQLNLEAACWPLTNLCFLTTSHLKSLRVNRDALLHASF